MWVSFQIDLWLFSASHKNKPQQVPFNFWWDKHSRGLLPIFVRIYSVTSYRDPPHFIIKSRTIALIGMPRAHRKISVIFHPEEEKGKNRKKQREIKICVLWLFSKLDFLLWVLDFSSFFLWNKTLSVIGMPFVCQQGLVHPSQTLATANTSTIDCHRFYSRSKSQCLCLTYMKINKVNRSVWNLSVFQIASYLR